MLRRLSIASFLFCLAAAAPASAEIGREQYAVSPSPYWRVGTYDEKLSEACRRRTFGQRLQYRYTIGFVGEKGQGIRGSPPASGTSTTRTASPSPGSPNHFFSEGYSNCRVYVAKPKKKRA